MFEKLFKKTTKKAETAIDNTAKNVDGVVLNAKKLMDESKHNMDRMFKLAIIAFTLGITADVISIAVGLKTVRLLKK